MNVDGIYIVKGDLTGDQKITVDDLITMKSHLLGLDVLTGDALIAADTNNAGDVTAVDLANIQKHILGVTMLTEVVTK